MAEVEVTGDAVVEVGVGDEVVVRLPENATTGYVWTVDRLGSGLELLDDRMVPPAEAVPGAGGARVVRVRATAPGRHELVMQLGRAWEPQPAERRLVTVTVTG